MKELDTGMQMSVVCSMFCSPLKKMHCLIKCYMGLGLFWKWNFKSLVYKSKSCLYSCG